MESRNDRAVKRFADEKHGMKIIVGQVTDDNLEDILIKIVCRNHDI